MDLVVYSQKFTNHELTQMNLCRLYLRAFFLSDLCSGNGRGIMDNYKSGLRSPHRTSIWIWSRQQRPSPKDWKLWNIAIAEVWTCSETHLLSTPFRSMAETFPPKIPILL